MKLPTARCSCARALILALVWSALGTTAFAAVPALINYQGRATDSGGNALTGAYSLTFRIYDDPAGGGLIWSETQNPVNITNGLFSTLLGSVTPLGPNAFTSPERYLSIQVGADPELTPRQRIVSVAFAQRVATIDGTTGGYVEGNSRIEGSVVIGSGDADGTLAFAAGANNNAAGNYSIALGADNSAIAAYSSVGGGSANLANGIAATVVAGVGNTASGDSAFVGAGGGNTASGSKSFIGGGRENQATGDYSHIGGGWLNYTESLYSTVGGGERDSAIGQWSTIAGGRNNDAEGIYSTIGGGTGNRTAGTRSFIGGGTGNFADGFDAIVVGGENCSTLVGGGFVGGGDNNVVEGVNGVVAGGIDNRVTGYASAILGGINNQVDGDSSVIVGGLDNIIALGASWSAIGGGRQNTATGYNSVIGGGWLNTATGNYSAITGGSGHSASGPGAFIGGGVSHTATKPYATVIGGGFNDCAGGWSTILGGSGNVIEGTLFFDTDFSLVFGQSVACRTSNRAMIFNSSSPGRLGINRDSDDGGLAHPVHVGTTTTDGNGARLTATGVWTDASSREFKENFVEMGGSELLDKIAQLSLPHYNYKGTAEKHIGPMAEDFAALFNVGSIDETTGQIDNRYLSAKDVAGVSLAGVKELIRKNAALEQRIAKLEALLQSLSNGKQ